jgi:protein-disulfide isomerase
MPLTGFRPIWSWHLWIPRALLAALSWFAFDALVSVAMPSAMVDAAWAQSTTAALLATPMSLPEMALGSPKARVTIIGYFSLTCPHCAGFEENVLPLLQTNYIDSGKVRFVAREFPLDAKAIAGATLVRCIAAGDSKKYFDALAQLFILQPALINQPLYALQTIGHRFGLDDQAVETCMKDQAQLDKLKADVQFAIDQLKVEVTPTFFINGEMFKGTMTYEDLDKKLAPLVKR